MCWIKLTPNQCIDRALQAPSKSHERAFWFELAGLMIEADKPITHDPRYAVGGLTMQQGSLYHQQVGEIHREKMERIHRYGTNF